jgi:hypothetical protein
MPTESTEPVDALADTASNIEEPAQGTLELEIELDAMHVRSPTSPPFKTLKKKVRRPG